jgi:UDP:flavonoid glycosyltransferase YjiC (YdhE family)
VPQVVLPQWADCYDFANRAEYLGIGRWGNKSEKPRWKADELCSILVDVLLGPDAEAMKSKSRHLSKICSADGEGRVIAARTILAAIQEDNHI